MPAATTRSTFPAGLIRDIRAIVGHKYKEFAPEYTNQFTKVPSKMSSERYNLVGGLGIWPQKEELADFSLDSLVAGPRTEMVNLEYGLGAIVSQTMLEDQQYPEILNMMAMLARSGRETIELSAVQVYVNGFTDTGADGQALFSNSHPCYKATVQYGTTVFDNLVTSGALSHTTFWDAIDQAAAFVDDAGNHINVTMGRMVLIVPQPLERIAADLMFNQNVAGTADNDINTVKKAGHQWSYAVNHYTTDLTAWYLYFPDVDNGMIFQWRIQPQFYKDETFGRGHRFEGRMRFIPGYVDQRAVVGNAGV